MFTSSSSSSLSWLQGLRPHVSLFLAGWYFIIALGPLDLSRLWADWRQIWYILFSAGAVEYSLLHSVQTGPRSLTVSRSTVNGDTYHSSICPYGMHDDDLTFPSTVIHSFVSWHVHSLFQSQFFTQCDQVLPLSIYHIISFPSAAAYVSFFVFPSLRSPIFLSVAGFRTQFLCKMWPIQLAFPLFNVCRMSLFSLTLCNTS